MRGANFPSPRAPQAASPRAPSRGTSELAAAISRQRNSHRKQAVGATHLDSKLSAWEAVGLGSSRPSLPRLGLIELLAQFDRLAAGQAADGLLEEKVIGDLDQVALLTPQHGEDECEVHHAAAEVLRR